MTRFGQRDRRGAAHRVERRARHRQRLHHVGRQRGRAGIAGRCGPSPAQVRGGRGRPRTLGGLDHDHGRDGGDHEADRHQGCHDGVPAAKALARGVRSRPCRHAVMVSRCSGCSWVWRPAFGSWTWVRTALARPRIGLRHENVLLWDGRATRACSELDREAACATSQLMTGQRSPARRRGGRRAAYVRARRTEVGGTAGRGCPREARRPEGAGDG